MEIVEFVKIVIANCADLIQRDLGDIPLEKILHVLVKFGNTLIIAWEIAKNSKGVAQ